MRESKATGIPLMAVLGLSTLLFAAGCRGGEGGATGHVAAAAQDDPAPKGGCGGYCMGDSWCTNGPNGVCYAPGTPESIKHCGCGFCVGRSWCTCGPDGVCYIPEAQISIDHCGAYARCGGEQECPAGFVCEPTTPQCTDPRCIPGCRVGGAPCGCGLVCNQPLCFTCPCPGQCEPRPCDDGYCMGDSWCTQKRVLRAQRPRVDQSLRLRILRWPQLVHLRAQRRLLYPRGADLDRSLRRLRRLCFGTGVPCGLRVRAEQGRLHRAQVPPWLPRRRHALLVRSQLLAAQLLGPAPAPASAPDPGAPA